MELLAKQDRNDVMRRHTLAGAVALAAALLGAGCSIPINTGLGAPKAIEVSAADAADAGAQAYQLGNSDEAKRLIRNARDAAAANPTEQPNLARTLTSIAITQSQKGNNSEAIDLHSQALALRESTFGPNHPQVADSLSHLAACYYQAQRYGEAENAFRRALQIRQHHFGEDDRLTGLSMNNLAFFYAGIGKYDDADPLFRDSIRIISASDDATWTEKARALDNYAAMLLDAGRPDEAAKIQEESAQYRTKRKLAEDVIRVTK